MARLTFPDEGSRLLYDPATGMLLPVNTRVYLYLDSAATQPAIDLLDGDGNPVTVGYVTSDAYKRLPLFSGPDGADTLYAVVSGTGPITPIYARDDDRLDALNTRVTALETDSPQTAVQSVNGHTGTTVTLSKTDVGLGNVDNTSDVNKPVSTAQQTAISAAVAGLVNSAPAALDTLNELATALGDDANFAATMTTALAGKLNVVVHGVTAGTARPAAAPQVLWVGTVAPTNATTNDLWFDKTAVLLKLWSGTAWLASGNGSYELFLTPTATKTANYTASPGDLVVCDTTSGAFTVTLPTTPADNTRVAAKMITQGGTNTVTIAAGGTDHIATGNATSRSLTILGEAVELQYQASTGLWFIPASDTPVGQLDLRYGRLGNANEWQSMQTLDGGLTLGTPNGISANVWFTSASQGWQGGPKWEFGIDTSNNGGGLDFYFAKAAWRIILDGVTNTDNSLTSARAQFGTSDQGKPVSGPGIQAGTTILSVTNPTTVVLSQPTTATATGVAVTIGTVNAVGDLIYVANGAGGDATVGVGVTPPGTTHRLQVAASSANPALGTLRLSGVAGQTGDYLTINDSGNTTRLQVDSNGIIRGNNASFGGVGFALQVGAQVKINQMANSGLSAVYGWEFNANTGTTLKFRYETGGKDLLTFDTGGNAVLGPTGLATNSTNGFVHIPYMAGAPTGTPTAFSGHMPLTIDTTNSKLWAWTGSSWKGVNVATGDAYVPNVGTAWTDTAGDVKFVWQAVTDTAAGVGLRIDRTAGAAKFPSLLFSIGDVTQYGMGGLDTTVADGILAYDYLIPQSVGTKSGDTLRMSHGAHFIMGDGIGTPNTQHRLEIKSTGATDDPATVGALLAVTALTGSPVGNLLLLTGPSGQVANVNTSGFAAFGKTYSGTITNGALEVATGASITAGVGVQPQLQLVSSGNTTNRTWSFQVSTSDGGFNLRDVTGSVTPLQIQAGSAANTILIGTTFLRLGATATSVGFYGSSGAAKQTVTGALSTVTDAAAKAVLTSILAAMTGVNLVTNGTT